MDDAVRKSDGDLGEASVRFGAGSFGFALGAGVAGGLIGSMSCVATPYLCLGAAVILPLAGSEAMERIAEKAFGLDGRRDPPAKAPDDLPGSAFRTPVPAPRVAGDTCFDWGMELTFRGTFVERTYPGRPNFTSVAEGDEPVDLVVLQIPNPICFHPDNSDPEWSIPGETGVTELWALGDIETPVGREVILTGRAMPPASPHYHTRAVLSDARIMDFPEPGDLDEPDDLADDDGSDIPAATPLLLEALEDRDAEGAMSILKGIAPPNAVCHMETPRTGQCDTGLGLGIDSGTQFYARFDMASGQFRSFSALVGAPRERTAQVVSSTRALFASLGYAESEAAQCLGDLQTKGLDWDRRRVFSRNSDRFWFRCQGGYFAYSRYTIDLIAERR
ncbi:hypothetical protein LAZ40_05670 [Cereibacter sphaeroides]|uniref:hypothetical protein n=1 Tax=Cereibacter sphaeroides TaxID=1063 RepID=UPI001F2BA2D0|nr:hypothetical protein [Cereibacter sphaeroides]MCE6958538.1 hypothetical protein [Cereibacter sphaeroides]MCE6972799.1 hypothetical protein [Cereibacter sphaeroides]